MAELGRDMEEAIEDEPMDEQSIADDQLRLIFTCCHPALAPDAQVALTLREICGLTTEQVAAAFVVPTTTLAQRIVRAKGKIRDARIPYAVPEREQLPERLHTVLHTIYLVFNEGYSAPADGADLAAEAIRLGRLLLQLMPATEVAGLLALMLLNESRRAARVDADGEIVLLSAQDRALWNRAQIAEGLVLATRAGTGGAFALQAAIAAVHAQAEFPADTDWRRIATLYGAVLALQPNTIVALNRAVAIAECDGPEAGLALIDDLIAGQGLDGYYLAHAARADMLRRLGRAETAMAAYRRALDLATQPSDRRFLERRLAELQQSSAVSPTVTN